MVGHVVNGQDRTGDSLVSDDRVQVRSRVILARTAATVGVDRTEVVLELCLL